MNIDDRIAALEKLARTPPLARAQQPSFELEALFAEIDGETALLAAMDARGRVEHWRQKVAKYEGFIASNGVVDGDDWQGASAGTLEILRELRVEIAHDELPELRAKLAQAEMEVADEN